METMLAAVLHDFNDLRLEQVPRPKPAAPGTVVVRVKSCGICGTDYKAVKGVRTNVTFPAIVGHEPSGIIAEVGPGVIHFKEGDEIICQPMGYCGVCEHCRASNTHYCMHGFVTGGDGQDDVWPGAFAEYMCTTENSLFLKPAGLSFDAAALTEPLSGAWKGVVQYSEMRVGDDVVIIGAGSMGLLCQMVAKAAGAAQMIAIDPSPYARQQALALGATHAIDPVGEDAKSRVYEIIPGGPDLIIEAAGPIEAVKLMSSLRRRGTRWNVFGITTHETFELDGGLTHFLEGRMDASFGTTPLAMSRAIRLMDSGLVDTEKIISHRFPLSEIHQALKVMGGEERTKVIVNP
ncbi:alcohol dehydrogenase catalytic domain-containing protein [candidate division KSB1 bacterium]|nr:alcohol dehydrogenase catalytic domain-containing protein [candidate division KSB1 bacterium]